MKFDCESELGKNEETLSGSKSCHALKGAEFHLGNEFGVFEQDHEKGAKIKPTRGMNSIPCWK